MKYLKTIEKYKRKKSIKIYWLLPKQNNTIFKLALKKKIKCPDSYINLLFSIKQIEDLSHIFIGYNSNEKYNSTNGWDWMGAPDGLKYLNNEIFEKDGYKFGETINIKDYEINAEKYNI